MYRRIKYIEGKSSKPSTTFVTQQTNSITREIIENISLEKVIIAENLKEYHHTEGAWPLLDDPWMYLDIGDFDKGP